MNVVLWNGWYCIKRIRKDEVVVDLFTREDWRLFTSFSTLPQKAGVDREDLSSHWSDIVKRMVRDSI